MRDEDPSDSPSGVLYVELTAIVLVVSVFCVDLWMTQQWCLSPPKFGTLADLIVLLLLGAAFASFISVFVGALVWALLRHKEPWRAKHHLIMYGCLIGIVSMATATSWVALAGPVGVIILAAVRFITLPDYTFDRRFCRQCQYDLTGNESGVCPECGTPVGEA